MKKLRVYGSWTGVPEDHWTGASDGYPGMNVIGFVAIVLNP